MNLGQPRAARPGATPATARSGIGRFSLWASGLLIAALFLLAVRGCESTGSLRALSSAEDARRFIDEVAHGRGTAALGIGLLPDADQAAVAAFEDAVRVRELGQVVAETPSEACEVVGLVDELADAAPRSVSPVMGQVGLSLIERDAARVGVPAEVTGSVLDAAGTMAQSTWIDAAESLCGDAEGP